MKKAMATHSSTLAWKIPWAEEPGRLRSVGSQRFDMIEWLSSHTHTYECCLPVNNPLQWIPSAAAAKSLQSCPTLCNPIDGSLPGSPVPGMLQARILEWVAISFSSAWKWKVRVKSLSCVWLLDPTPKVFTSLSVQLLSRVQLFVTPWTAARQASLSVTNSQSMLQLMSIKSLMPSNHLIRPPLWHRPIIPLELHIFIVIFTRYHSSKEQRVHPV